ncbi:hypothetical protein C4573_05950 [Candidatus Woesearchaeota archaeon]|nr:MAG: hypothetical protein C4573_05950 [Candidatus Woesearchaeota archaeon]
MQKNHAQLLETIKQRLKPDVSVMKEIDAFVSDLNKKIKQKKIKAVCVKGGSVAKQTFLKNDYDVDLFVKFDVSYKKKNISALLKTVLPKTAVMVHGSRDYFQLHRNLHYELVPVLHVKNYKEAANVTDMSPLHVGWVLQHVKKNPKLPDEIRLAKQFCKANNCYGAESYIRGFSGHILDILIIYYGSFLALLKNAQQWNNKVIIDPEKQLKNPLQELNSAKTESPLIIVDPVQKNRNAAAALSREKFLLFKQKAKAFLKKPSEKYFQIITFTEEKIQKKYEKKKKNHQLIMLKIEPVDGKKDVVGSKILKVFEYLDAEMKKKEFAVEGKNWQFEPALIYFLVKKEKLSHTLYLPGPPLHMTSDVLKFKKKHKKTIIKNKRIFAVEKRKYKDAKSFITDAIKNSYVKEKVKKISLA